MGKRLLSIWPVTNKNKIYKDLINEFSLDYLVLTVEDLNDLNHIELNIKYDYIYTSRSIDYYLKNHYNYPPISVDLLNDAQEYEKTALDIIYRWRLSLVGSSHYLKITDLYYKLLRYWVGYINENAFDMIFISYIPHSIHNYLIYVVAKIKNIQIAIGRTAPFLINKPYVYYFSEDFNILHKNFNKYYDYLIDDFSDKKNVDKNVLVDYLKKYIDNDDSNRTLVTTLRKNKFKIISKRFFLEFKNRNFTNIIRKFYKLLILGFSDKKILKYCEKHETIPDLNIKYVYFPLHWQFEATTLPNGGIFRNQLLAIELVAQHLPIDYKLFVKEHPAYWLNREKFDYIKDTRNKEFYKRIVSLNNVNLVKHDFDNNSLIAKAHGIITINGSVGFEALRIGKPVMMFGNSFYMFYKNVYHVKKNSDIKAFFDSLSNKSHQQTFRELIIFFKALEKVSVEMKKISSKKDYLFNEKNIAKGLVDFFNLDHLIKEWL